MKMTYNYICCCGESEISVNVPKWFPDFIKNIVNSLQKYNNKDNIEVPSFIGDDFNGHQIWSDNDKILFGQGLICYEDSFMITLLFNEDYSFTINYETIDGEDEYYSIDKKYIQPLIELVYDKLPKNVKEFEELLKKVQNEI